MIRKLKNAFHLLQAWYWAARCGWPGKKLYLIGVTGTDGKTTTCTLIYEILKAAGFKAGLLTTVVAKIGDEEIDTGLHTTNPGPEILQPLLKKMLEAGVTHAVMEVTSHGLDQNRLRGCDFKIGVLTNITHEHLDYHKTMQNYVKTKAKLFEGVEWAILNGDIPEFENFKFEIRNLNKFAARANLKLKISNYTKTKLRDISPALAGEYNKYNIAAAEVVAKILDIRYQILEEVVKNFAGVPGRREEVQAGQKFRVMVDFAHTPNALEQVLKSLRQAQGKHKLILVFGCTGERDKAKRPMMGEIAGRLADIVIVTSDDTRRESQDEIAKQIMAGIPRPGGIFVINDRREAIKKAISLAKPGDTVLLAGKGHEESLLIGTTEIPWSDKEVARTIIMGVHEQVEKETADSGR